MRVALASLLTAVTFGCDPGPPEPPEKPPAYTTRRDEPVTWCTKPGLWGRLNFDYFQFGGVVARAVATGATAGLSVCLRSTLQSIPRVREVRSSNPQVATFSQVPGLAFGPRSPSMLLYIEALAPGAADAVLLGESGGEIDRFTIRVETPTGVEISAGLGAAPAPTVLGGVEHLVAAEHLPRDLTGCGAVQIEYRGALRRSPRSEYCIYLFSGVPGTGEIVARAGGAEALLQVRVVAPEQLDSLVLSPATYRYRLPTSGWYSTVGELKALFRASGVPVHGARCTWSVPDTAKEPRLGSPLFVSPMNIALPAAATYLIDLDRQSYDATCRGPGGLSAVLPIRYEG